MNNNSGQLKKRSSSPITTESAAISSSESIISSSGGHHRSHMNGINLKIRKISNDNSEDDEENDDPPSNDSTFINYNNFDSQLMSDNFDPMAVLRSILDTNTHKQAASGEEEKQTNLPLDLMKKCLTMLHNKQMARRNEGNVQENSNSTTNYTSQFEQQKINENYTSNNNDHLDVHSFEEQFLGNRQKLPIDMVECRKNFYNYDKPTLFQKMLYSSELSPNQKLVEKNEDMLRRFASFDECLAHQCSKTLTREHYHCTQCERVIVRREEMIRHVKWHKKREESLQYGFMRFSPNDDCKNFTCIHNGKQTHYHCLQLNCPKIYVSTSDVQMHANYHRKDAIIMQDGFQRYRATEDCGMNTCPFFAERTTHFHCRRPECFFTFKNKADIEKHKGHHQKNDNYSRDGFRKYIKYEPCDFEGCKYSKIMNHIHCIRKDCNYVVHSSSQILSHRRKHERHQISSTSSTPKMNTDIYRDEEDYFFPLQTGANYNDVMRDFRKKVISVVINAMTLLRLNESDRDIVYIEISDPIGRELFAELHSAVSISDEMTCLKYTDCSPNHGHYHCSWEGCEERRGSLFKFRSHWLSHAWTGAVLRCGLMKCRIHNGCQITSHHYHCLFWPECNHVIMGDNVSRNHCPGDLCEHLLINEYANVPVDQTLSSSSQAGFTSLTKDKQKAKIISQQSSPKSLFQSFNYSSATPRRRGRPPKHKRDVHVPHVNPMGKIICNYSLEQNLTREMFIKQKSLVTRDSPNHGIVFGIRMYEEGEQCIDEKCHFQQGLQEHYHCARPRCYLVSQSLVYINMHRKEFHGHLTIDDGFEHFDRTVDCRRRTCHNNRLSRHYHCIRSDCDYSFVRYSTMRQHGKKHEKDPESSYGEDDRTSTNHSPSNTSNISISEPHQSGMNLSISDSYKRLRDDIHFKISNIFPGLNSLSPQNLSAASSSNHDLETNTTSTSSQQHPGNYNSTNESNMNTNPFISVLGLQPFGKVQHEMIISNFTKCLPSGNQPSNEDATQSVSDLLLKHCFEKLATNNGDFPIPMTPNSIDRHSEELSLFDGSG